MNIEKPEPTNLKGALLLADPTLLDENFARTVVLLTDHQKESGTHGLVINRTLDQKVGDILKGPEFAPLRKVPVHIGGPVGREHLTFAALAWEASQDALRFATHLSLEDAIARMETGETIRAFLGYSGWGRGQLENEITLKSWVPRKPSRDILKAAPDESLWRKLLTTLGPWGALVAGMPERPSLN